MHYANTRIYQRSLDLVSLGRDVIANLPPGCGFLADQLRRSTASVALNFAEGCGKATPAEQRRFFRIAKGSAYETYAVLDVALRLGAISPELHARGSDVCDHLAAMLTRFRRI